MISYETLRGYMLEEILAYLIRNTGYKLLIDDSQDPIELGWERNGLVVKGRGALHQVDVLGELMWIPAFTYPLRLFVEAKFRDKKTDIATVRSAVGSMLDINQNNMPQAMRLNGGNPQIRPKYQYVAAIFSSSGFSRPAMDMALAHGVSLIDLGIGDFQPLLCGISESARTIYGMGRVMGSAGVIVPEVMSRGAFIHSLRNALRSRLGTLPDLPNGGRQSDPYVQNAVSPALDDAIQSAREVGELFVGMGSGPYMIVLKASDPDAFLAYAQDYPSHDVHITWNRKADNGETWFIRPAYNPDQYSLSFRLPQTLSEWIFSKDNVRRAAMNVKNTFFSNITIYRHVDGRDQLFRLRFNPQEIRECDKAAAEV